MKFPPSERLYARVEGNRKNLEALLSTEDWLNARDTVMAELARRLRGHQDAPNILEGAVLFVDLLESLVLPPKIVKEHPGKLPELK